VAALALTDPGTTWDRLLFSAKESVFKAWFSLTEQTLPMKEIKVTFRQGGVFFGSVQSNYVQATGANEPSAYFGGRWIVNGGLLLTAVAPRPEALSSHHI
jgi:4'-phosphopantetheinyl transferase EntD